MKPVIQLSLKIERLMGPYVNTKLERVRFAMQIIPLAFNQISFSLACLLTENCSIYTGAHIPFGFNGLNAAV